MGINDLKILVVRLWKYTIFSIITCYRSVRDHPLASLMAVLFYLFYTFLPSVFGFLISSSPIVVCTIVLLGAFLNFGYPQNPEFDQKTTISSSKDDQIVLKDERETHENEKESNDIKEKEAGLFPTHKDGLMDRTIVIEEKPRQIHPPKPPIKVDNKKLQSLGFIKERLPNSDIGNQSNKVLKKMKKMKGFKLGIDKPVCGMPNNHLREWLRDPSTHHHRNEENGESSDFGSDRAQCSSPLESITDIIPVFDELHPLLDFKQPLGNLSSIEESDPPSEWSGQSNDGSVVSELEESEEEEGTENQGVEDEVMESEDDRVKDVVTWTEDDEKNLKDLRSSELERNQKLENLIARRKSRKTLSMDMEINLIDLESNEPQIAPIMATRNDNPFDAHFYSNETGEVQLVPASAPSVLLPRRNPFDLPFEHFDERSNLNGEQDVTPIHLDKDMSFCRHQSFSLGSHLGKDRRDFDLISFLEFERMESETARNPSLQRQFSEMSESKLSCVLETETVYTISDEEDEEKLGEDDLSPKSKLVSRIGHSPDRAEQVSQTSEEVDSVEIDQEDLKDYHSSEVDMQKTDGEITHPSASSPSSSEVTAKLLHEVDNEVELQNQEQKMIAETSNLVKPSLSQMETESKSMDPPDDKHIEEPVYDSSPSAMESMTIEALLSGEANETLTSNPSKPSDSNVETSEGGSNPVKVEEVSLVEEEKSISCDSDRSIKNETATHDNVVMQEETSSGSSTVEVEGSRSRELTNNSEQSITEDNDTSDGGPVTASPALKLADQESRIDLEAKSSQSDSTRGSQELQSESAKVPVDPNPNSPPVEKSVEDGLVKEASSPSRDPEIHVGDEKPDLQVEQHKTSSSAVASKDEKVTDQQLSSNGGHEEPKDASIQENHIEEKKTSTM